MNFFDIASLPLEEEFFETVLSEKDFRVERIVSKSHCSPKDFWYDQDENEWVMILEGYASIEYKDGSQKSLSKGDCLLIPKHVKHRVAETCNLSETIWLALFWK